MRADIYGEASVSRETDPYSGNPPAPRCQGRHVKTIFCVTCLLGFLGVAQAARLPPDEVTKIAESAAKQESYDGLSFTEAQPPAFDRVTQVWRVDFRGVRVPEFGHEMKFSVFVYDATSRTAVGCLGTDTEGVVPSEIRPFMKNEDFVELICGDLNGDGFPDLLLITENQKSEIWYRRLQILIRRPDGTLTFAVSNSNVVQNVDGVGGSFEVHARRNKFVVTNVLAGMHWDGSRRDYYFEYSQSGGTWVLTRVEYKVLGANYHDEHDRTWLPKELGTVKFGEVDDRKFMFGDNTDDQDVQGPL